MDFDEYETFLENLSSVMRGINRLIQKAKGKKGKRFIWSPVAPDVVEEGALNHVERGLIYTDSEDISQVILKHLNYENFIIELVYTNIDNGSYYLLSIGY